MVVTVPGAVTLGGRVGHTWPFGLVSLDAPQSEDNGPLILLHNLRDEGRAFSPKGPSAPGESPAYVPGGYLQAHPHGDGEGNDHQQDRKGNQDPATDTKTSSADA